MPYYCTVPRCTSMAGKAKNVSFHQFPRDEELARLWNKVLKRGKPYTKYSKVCSLHFRPEDYTITSVGKNKGQWRTLRKDAVPSQNLPSESPAPTTHHRSRNSGCWLPSNAPTPVVDPRVQHSMAQAIYMQTMLALAASNGTHSTQNDLKPLPTDLTTSHQSNPPIPDLEQILENGHKDTINTQEIQKQGNKVTSYKCLECSKCFKDPDVFVLHRRTHTKNSQERLPETGKENIPNTEVSRQETLRANPILANLLKSGMASPQTNDIPDLISNFNGVFDTNNILSIENQIMTALAANMESYIRNLTSMLSEANNKGEDKSSAAETENGDPSSGCEEENGSEDSENVDGENLNGEDEQNALSLNKECQNAETDRFDTDKVHKNVDEGQECQNTEKEFQDVTEECQDIPKECQNHDKLFHIEIEGSHMEEDEPSCDNEDLNDSKDSLLVIDENA